MIALLGSQALVRRLGGNALTIGRVPVDWDVVGPYSEVTEFANRMLGTIEACYPTSSGNKLVIKKRSLDGVRNGLTIIDAELAWPKASTTSYALWKLIKSDPETVRQDKVLIPSIHVLYLLKMTHRYLKNSPHFLKTMRDIHLLRRHGAEIQPQHRDFFKERERATYSYQHPKLNVTKGDFFKGDGVEYVYDHDSIHEAMKHLDVPAYQLYKAEGAEVNCAREKFFEAPEHVRLYGVLEETYVLALERSQIPFPETDPKRSFEIALRKVCTSITSGWFREYAWESYDKIWEMYDPEYVEKFKRGIEAGVVMPHK